MEKGQTSLHWISTSQMLSDSLTKEMDNSYLISRLETSLWSYREDSTVSKLRSGKSLVRNQGTVGHKVDNLKDIDDDVDQGGYDRTRAASTSPTTATSARTSTTRRGASVGHTARQR